MDIQGFGVFSFSMFVLFIIKPIRHFTTGYEKEQSFDCNCRNQSKSLNAQK